MDYAQARLQARFGERPDESLWRELEQAPDPAAVLDLARRSPLRRWVAGLAPDAGRHAIETALRARWRDCVGETAGWMPEAWRPAMLWARVLVDLPALAHLGRGGVAPAWMQQDPVLQAYAAGDPARRPGMARQPGHEPPSPVPPDRSLPDWWLQHWRERRPRWSDAAALESLAASLQRALQQPEASGRPLLERELRRRFRQSVLSPAAAFVYLAFAALDMARLRAALLRPAMAREGIA